VASALRSLGEQALAAMPANLASLPQDRVPLSPFDMVGLPALRAPLDPAGETQRYIDKIMASRGRDPDDAGRALLPEDLRSPCTEEVAVFHAFSRIVSEARSAFVVLDTAPTGHTLLLMEATGAYHRQMTREFEAAGLQGDLRRARIEPFAWVVNRSLAACGTRDPVLAARLAGEAAQLARVTGGLAKRTYVVPWVTRPPVGIAALRGLVDEAR
jgi:arsenite-transporting ATPase